MLAPDGLPIEDDLNLANMLEKKQVNALSSTFPTLAAILVSSTITRS